MTPLRTAEYHPRSIGGDHLPGSLDELDDGLPLTREHEATPAKPHHETWALFDDLPTKPKSVEGLKRWAFVLLTLAGAACAAAVFHHRWIPLFINLIK
jgi:hypothetical protein